MTDPKQADAIQDAERLQQLARACEDAAERERIIDRQWAIFDRMERDDALRTQQARSQQTMTSTRETIGE